MKKPILVFCAGLGLLWSFPAVAGDEPPVRGEGNALPYLRAMHAKIHHLWAESFLVMAEGQLPKDHAINVPSRVTELEVIVSSEGKLAQVKVAKPSGSTDFDNSATDVIKAAAPFGIAYENLLSDDGKVHVLWTLARDDRRCSGARVEVTASPLEEAPPSRPAACLRGHAASPSLDARTPCPAA